VTTVSRTDFGFYVSTAIAEKWSGDNQMNMDLFESVKKIDVGAGSQPVKDWKERWSTAVKPNTFRIVETAMGPKILYRNTNSQTFVTWPRKIEDNRIVGVPNRSWIKEAVTEYFTDPKAFMKKMNENVQDPTREEMLEFLRGQLGTEEGFEGDAEAAMYWFANNYHGGQDSNLYSVLSTSDFSPGPIARGPEKESTEEDMYNLLVDEFAGGQRDTDESKVAECDVPGTMPPQETPDVDAAKNSMEDYSETEDPNKLKDKTKENDELKTREVQDKELEQKPPETKESKVNEANIQTKHECSCGSQHAFYAEDEETGKAGYWCTRCNKWRGTSGESKPEANAPKTSKSPKTKESKTPVQKPRGYRIRESLRFCPSCNKTFRSNEAKCKCGNERTENLSEGEYSNMVGLDKPIFKVEYTQDGQKNSTRVAAFDEDDARRSVERMKRGAKATKAVKVGEAKANEDNYRVDRPVNGPDVSYDDAVKNQGLAAKAGKTPGDFDADQVEIGTKVEMEHTNDREKAKQIAMDHLTEDPEYYKKLRKMESGARDESEVEHDLIVDSGHDGMAHCKCGKWEYQITGELDKKRMQKEFERHRAGRPRLYRSQILGRDVTIPENESVSPSSTIDQLAEEYAQIIAADLPDGGTGDMRMEAIHTRTVDLWNDFNQIVANKLKDHGVTIVGEGKVPDDADPEDKKIEKLTEGIVALLNSMEEIPQDEKDAIMAAIEDGQMSNEWPSEEEMIDDLSQQEDMVDPEKLGSDMNLRMAWLKYVAPVKALAAVGESKVNEQFPEKMMPGQKPYTDEERKKREALTSAAAKAVDAFGDDELEAYAEQIKKRQQQGRK